ncbi:MAG: hypothetical protein JG770_1917 [Mahella sp.]|nr:hypothetical protein [Mahella sp.]
MIKIKWIGIINEDYEFQYEALPKEDEKGK